LASRPGIRPRRVQSDGERDLDQLLDAAFATLAK
jgi:hypothetical protein